MRIESRRTGLFPPQDTDQEASPFGRGGGRLGKANVAPTERENGTTTDQEK